MKTLILAEHIAPMDGPLIRGGAVVFEEGRILAVGLAREIRAAHPDAIVEDQGQSVLLPGLVNAHTHLELSDCIRDDCPPAGFVPWLKCIVRRIAADPAAQADTVARAIAIGVRECLRFGVSTVGDISRHCGLTRPLLKDSPLRVISFGEIQAMGQRRGLLDQRLAAALDQTCVSDRLRIGLTPHAPYTVEPFAYARCLQIARERGLPLATHLAETPHEATFLADGAGAFREFWEFLGLWDEQIPQFPGGPIRLAQSLGLLDHPTLLAHVNYCDDDEMNLLAAGRASVVYNPRTHAWFGHPPHRWREMLSRGINVAVGTDSRASSPDLNLVDELRLLHRIDPEMPAARLWEMATIRSARALLQDGSIGSITVGKVADFVAFSAGGDDPLADILHRPASPSALWISGSRH